MPARPLPVSGKVNDAQFVSDLANLLRRHKVHCGAPADLELLGSALEGNPALCNDLFLLCTAISHMREADLSPAEMLDLVTLAVGGPRVAVADDTVEVSEHTRAVFLELYAAWLARSTDPKPIPEDSSVSSAGEDEWRNAETRFSRAKERSGGGPGLRDGSLGGRSGKPISPDMAIGDLTLRELSEYLASLEQRVKRAEAHLVPQQEGRLPATQRPVQRDGQFEGSGLESITNRKSGLEIAKVQELPQPSAMEGASPIEFDGVEPELSALARSPRESVVQRGLATNATVRTHSGFDGEDATEVENSDYVAAPRSRRRVLTGLVGLGVVAAALALGYFVFERPPATETPQTPGATGQIQQGNQLGAADSAVDAAVSAQTGPEAANASKGSASNPVSGAMSALAHRYQEALAAAERSTGLVTTPAPVVRQLPPAAEVDAVNTTVDEELKPAPITRAPPIPSAVKLPEEPAAATQAPAPVERAGAGARPAIATAAGGGTQARTGPVSIPSSALRQYEISAPVPRYPLERKLVGDTSVLVRATISKDGRVTSVHAESGPDDLRAAAETAMRQWRFRPYQVGGASVEVATSVTFLFRAH